MFLINSELIHEGETEGFVQAGIPGPGDEEVGARAGAEVLSTRQVLTRP